MVVIFSYALADIAIVVATGLVVAYLYFANAYSYWKRRGVHCIQPTLLFGNLGGVVLLRENISEYLKKVYDENPSQPFVGLYSARRPFLMVRDLGMVRNVMVKDAQSFLDRAISAQHKGSPLLSRSLFFLNGKKWRHVRVKLTPTFTSGKIKQMFHLINECGKELLPCIDQEMSKGKSVVVKDTVARYTTDVIASCAFGIDSSAIIDPSCKFREITRQIFERTSLLQNVTFSLSIFAPWVVKVLGLKLFDDSVNTYVRKTFWDVADYRKKNKVVRKDFVDILMQIKNEGDVKAEDAKDLDEIKEDSKYMEVEHNRSDKVHIHLESDDFVAQAFVFIAAGFETSSSVISFTLYELALNPDVQNKLRQEILAVLDKHNSEVTYDAITDMHYLEMVVSEAMRKHPTLPVLDRICVSDYKIPGTEITIEKGTKVIIPVLAIHLDPAIYPEPDKFDPERFSIENKSKRSNFAHIPFGEGPRLCIGMRFGQMQVKTALIHILTSYHVKPCAETPQPPLDMVPNLLVNTPKKDIILTFEKVK